MPEQIKAFRCKYKCGKIGTKAYRIEEHVLMCFNNPQSQSCKTCDNFSDDNLSYGECLKVGITFIHSCVAFRDDSDFKMQTRCMYYDNAKNGIYGAPEPIETPKDNSDKSPNLQFEFYSMEASK